MSIFSINDDEIFNIYKCCANPLAMCCNTRVMTQDEIMQKIMDEYESVMTFNKDLSLNYTKISLDYDTNKNIH